MKIVDHWQEWDSRPKRLNKSRVIFDIEIESDVHLEKLADGGFKLTIHQNDETDMEYKTEVFLTRADLDKLIEVNDKFL